MLALGDKIQRMRVWRGITQTELASGLVTPSMISQIESNKANPSTELLLRIIEKLGISVETFLKDVYLDLGGRGLYRFALDLMEFDQHGAAFQFLKQLEERPNVVDANELQYQIAICLQNTGKVEEAIEKLDEVLTEIQSEDDQEFIGKVFYQLADAYFKKHDLSLAYFYGNKADTIMNDLENGDRYIKARIKNLLGIVSGRFGQYAEAIEFYKAAMELYLPNQPEKIPGMLTNLGIDYKNLGNYKESEKYFKQALEEYQKFTIGKNSIAAKYNYGVLLGLTAKYESALKMFEECLAEFQEQNYLDMLPKVYSEMAQVEISRGNHEQAKTFIEKGIEATNGEHPELAYLYKLLADIMVHMGKVEEAAQYLEKSIPIYQNYSRFADLVKMLPVLSKCYEQLGDVEKAVSTLEKSKVYMKNLL